MTKNKNYKKMAKDCFRDKVDNTTLLMKFLHAKGGLDLVKEYYTDALPDYIHEYEGFGDAKMWVLRQVAKSGPRIYMKKVIDQGREDSEYMFPTENYEVIEISDKQIKSKLKCKYMKALVKKGKKYKCDFDIRDYYCNHACMPLLKKMHSHIYLDFQIELIDSGCIQTIQMDESVKKKEKEENKTK